LSTIIQNRYLGSGCEQFRRRSGNIDIGPRLALALRPLKGSCMTEPMPRPAPSVFRVERLSTVDHIAIELRKAIFSGGLPVGRSLGEVEMAAQLGVSRSPLREAAQRLVQEGLLVAIPGRGLSVPEITGAQVEDLYEARLAIESQA